jgi:hypothetical protein
VVVQKRLHHPSHLHIVIIAEKSKTKAFPQPQTLRPKITKITRLLVGRREKGCRGFRNFPTLSETSPTRHVGSASVLDMVRTLWTEGSRRRHGCRPCCRRRFVASCAVPVLGMKLGARGIYLERAKGGISPEHTAGITTRPRLLKFYSRQ